MTDRSVVAAETNVEAGGFEIGSRRKVCRAYTVAHRYSFGRRNSAQWVAVLARAEKFLAECFERRLADSACYHDQMIRGDCRETVAERSPDFDFIAGPVFGQ